MNANQTIGAYFDQLSVTPGQTVTLHVGDLKRKNRACTLTLRRLGQDDTLLLNEPILLGEKQTPAGDAYESGYGFPPMRAVVVGGDWPSGVYEAIVQDDESELFARAQFIVKMDPGSGSTILLGIATHTQQAYNNGQGIAGLPRYQPYERSTYGYNSDGKPVPKVSYDRPGDIVSSWERRFIDWIDDKGIPIDYCSSVDMATMADWADHYHTYISVGHDEYWCTDMRNHVETFRQNGGNCLFLSGNNCYWQVRYEPTGRKLVCYKYSGPNATDDPTDTDAERTVLWIDPLGAGSSANTMTGLDYNYGGWANGRDSRFRVIENDHWLLQGTGLKRYQVFGEKLLTYEVDGLHIDHNTGKPVGDDGTPSDFTVVAFADCRDWNNALTTFDGGGVGVIGMFRDGGTVFNAGTVQWSVSLDPEPDKTDPIVERITLNVLSYLAAIPLYGFHTTQPWGYAYYLDANSSPEGEGWISDGVVMYVLPVPFPGSTVKVYAYKKGSGTDYRTMFSLSEVPPAGWEDANFSFYAMAKTAIGSYANLKPVYAYHTGDQTNAHYQYSFYDGIENGWDNDGVIFAAWQGPPENPPPPAP